MTSPLFSKAQYQEAADFIQQKINIQPQIGLILGSGLNKLAEAVEQPTVISYDEIPYWFQSTVVGHAGKLVVGFLAGVPVMVMQGRGHFYEGHSIFQITLPIRVMHLLGVHTLIVTNAAGGVNRSFKAGDLMLITDHINLPGMVGQNPLLGPNDETFGPRFPDMTFPYDLTLQKIVHEVAENAGISLQEGVYAFLTGPTYETPAELRFLKAMGVDAVGMSTVPSVVVARHAGMKVLGISSITNLCLLDPQPEATVTHEEVLETGKQIVPRLTRILRGVLQRLSAETSS